MYNNINEELKRLFYKSPHMAKHLAELEKEVKDRPYKLKKIQRNQSVESFHRRLGKIMWEYVGMSRNGEGLQIAIKEIKKLREEFYKDLFIPGKVNEYNYELEKATKVADFMELAELMAHDALNREESCGGHFREESVELDGEQKGEAKRNDKDYAYVAAWEYKGNPSDAVLHKEELKFEIVKPSQRSYK